MFEWFKKLFDLGRNMKIIPPINTKERLTIYKSIIYTKKIRPSQHLTGRLETANSKYDANNNQLHFKGKVISSVSNMRRYDVQLVFNDITNRLERDAEHIIPYSNTGSKIEYFIKKPDKTNTIATRCECFTADTLVIADGNSIPIYELVGREKFSVHSYDIENDKHVIGIGHSARLTRKNARIIRIIFNNDSIVKCTEDHLFLLDTNEYKQAKDLLPEDSLRSVDTSENYKVVSIKYEGYEDVYDLTVDKYHNFAIDLDVTGESFSGVYVHNCQDYYFMWGYHNKRISSHIGSYTPYKRVVPDSGRPPVNPTNSPGICKHLLIFIEWLEQREMISLDPDVKRYIDGIPRKR